MNPPTYIVQARYRGTNRDWLDLRTLWPDATPEERLAVLQEEKDCDRTTLEWRLIRRTVTEEVIA